MWTPRGYLLLVAALLLPVESHAVVDESQLRQVRFVTDSEPHGLHVDHTWWLTGSGETGE